MAPPGPLHFFSCLAHWHKSLWHLHFLSLFFKSLFLSLYTNNNVFVFLTIKRLLYNNMVLNKHINKSKRKKENQQVSRVQNRELYYRRSRKNLSMCLLPVLPIYSDISISTCINRSSWQVPSSGAVGNFRSKSFSPCPGI